jgi:hypothetical protein
MVGTVLTVILLVVAVAAVLHPLLRPTLEPIVSVTGPAARRAELEERKAAIYGAIRDAGFDFRTGKLVEKDYRHEVETLKKEAVEVLAEMEGLEGGVPRATEDLEARISELRDTLGRGGSAQAVEGTRFCTSCGERVQAEDRFCAACGQALRGAS